VGAIASNAISFVFPPLFYFSLIIKKKKQRKTQFYISIAIFSFFLPFGVASVIIKFLQTFKVIQ
jgi:hypothetical protein